MKHLSTTSSLTQRILHVLTQPIGVKKGKISSLAMLGIAKEKEYFLDNLSLLIASGMSVADALISIQKEVRSPVLKQIIKDVHIDIQDGETLWKSLSTTKLVTRHMIALIRIGEESGRLSENLKILVLQEQKARTFRQKIRSAMMYPVLLLLFTVLVGVLISWVILPKLSTVFGHLNIELPLLSKILIHFGVFLSNYGWIIIPSFLILFVSTLYGIFIRPQTKHIGQKILFQIPAIRTLGTNTELALMGFIAGTLLKAGVGITETLHSLKDSTDIIRYKGFYTHLIQQIEDGNGFEEGFLSFSKNQTYIPAPIQEMIITAERSGSLADTFLKIGENFEEKVETSTKNLSVLLEPILLVIVWLGVVGVALSVILPIYSLIGNLDMANTPTTQAQIQRNTINIQANTHLNNPEIQESPHIVLKPGFDDIPAKSLASDFAKTLTHLKPNTGYTYIKTSSGWHQIQLNDGSNGWVKDNFVHIKKE